MLEHEPSKGVDIDAQIVVEEGGEAGEMGKRIGMDSQHVPNMKWVGFP